MNLNRFINAQKTSYNIALSEIKSGRKRSHWMWFIFPQIRGLGFSLTAQYYAIQNRKEAEEYLVSKKEIFKQVLDKFFDGEMDEKTRGLLREDLQDWSMDMKRYWKSGERQFRTNLPMD